ncbi:MAG: response regulator [Spirochaetales bacterium]|nr:response regulator [Spirochaetales bacterium]
MELNIRNFFIGIAMALTIYHFMVWLGRKKDLSNLSFSLFNFTFVLFMTGTSVADYLKSDSYTIITSHLMSCLMSAVVTFFAYSVHIISKKLKSMVIISVVAIQIINAIAILLFFITGGNQFFSVICFAVTIIISVFINSLNIIFIIKDKIYKDETTRLFIIGFVILIVNLLIYLLIHTCIDSPEINEYKSLFLHIPFTIVLFIFAFILTRQFNREHMDLKELMKNLEKKVDERTKQLQDVNQQKTRFFINLAHETKTPLTLISNYFDEYRKLKGDSSESLIIKNNLEKLKNDMINFLDFEKLQSGQIFYHHDQVIDFSGIIQMQVLLFKELALNKKITFTVEIHENIYLKMDPSAAERVINNLLDNAIKYTQPEGHIFISLKGENTKAILSVADTGPGISEKQQKQIFKPFIQLSLRKRSIQGIGMGLNIVKTILDQINGSIIVKNNEEKGSIFEITLPRYSLLKDDIVANEKNEPAPYFPALTQSVLQEEKYIKGRATIFIVEDNEDMLSYLQIKLLPYYNVFYARNGKEALDKIKTIPLPDIIISDVMMDIIDGFEFYDTLKTVNEYCVIPFIFLTALTSTTDKIESLYKGAIDYIYKPFNIDELMGKIYSIMRIHDALKKSNLLYLGERLFHYLKHKETLKQDFTGDDDFMGRTVLKDLYEKYGISDQQIRIIALLKIGLLRKEICDRLDVSMNTLKTHMSRLFQKCGVDNKTELLNIFY